jgi:hypothetical protein
MRPPSILLFERLYIVKIVFGLVAGMFVFSRLSFMQVPADAPSAVQKLMPIITIGSIALSVAVSLLLLYFIARRASDVAKWIFIVLFSLGAIGLIWNFSHRLAAPSWINGLSFLQIAIEAVMLWLLFRPDAKAWFAGPSRQPPQDFRDTFS